MSDDLLHILTGGQESLAAPQAAPQAATPRADPLDYAVRTVYGEADPNNPDSQRAVAAVIRNRATKSGRAYDQVVQEPGQFEPWGDAKARSRMLALDPSSDDYKQIAANIAPVLNGEVALPYTHFYSPGVMKARGQSAPDWATGDGKQIGSQLFFAEPGAAPDLGSILGGGDSTGDAFGEAFADTGAPGAAAAAAGSSGSATIKMIKGQLVDGATGKALPNEQQASILALAKSGHLDLSGNAKPGALDFPWVQRAESDTFGPGEFYFDPQGRFHQTPGGAAPANAGFAGGLAAGLGDVPNSLFKVSGLGGTSLGQAMQGNRLIYDATHAGDVGAQAGRFLGQVAGSAPLLLSGEGALGALASRAPSAIAPALDFLAGNAGKAAVTNGAKVGGNLLLRGASLAARGAGEGGGAAALTSASSDRPLAEQLSQGALAGSLLGPTLPGAMGALKWTAANARGVLEPFTAGGREAIVSRFLAKQAEGGPTKLDLSEYVPGSTPTLAQATGNPKLAMVEQGVRTVNPSPFDALARGNQQARELAVDAARGDKQSLDDLIAARAQHTDPLREAAFAHTTPVDPTPVVAAIDTVLASPSGQRDAVVSALTNLRGKLVNPDGSMQTDPEQLWGVRQAIGDMLSPLAAGTKADGRLASRELMGVRDALDPVIEAGAPGFDAYRQAYADASRKIGAQEYLQKQNLTTSDGTISLGKVDTVLKRIEADRMKPGAHPAKDIPDEDLSALYSLRSDLQRQAQGFVGRGTGSNTVEKMASNKLLDALAIPSALGVGMTHPVAGAAIGLGKMALASQNKRVLETLTNRLLNPEPLTLSGVNTTPAQNRLLQLSRSLAGRAAFATPVIAAGDVTP